MVIQVSLTVYSRSFDFTSRERIYIEETKMYYILCIKMYLRNMWREREKHWAGDFFYVKHIVVKRELFESLHRSLFKSFN